MDDLVHDRSRVTAAVLDHYRIAALVLDERGDVGLSEFTPEDQEIALSMPEL